MADEEKGVQDKPVSEDGLGNAEVKENGVGKSPEKQVNGSFQEDQVNGVDKEYFWTDSQLVQGYVSNDAQRFHVYVANRVQRICETTDPQQWRYVESPADHTSRGLRVPEPIYSSWFHDPSFCGKINLRLNKGTPELLVRDHEVKKAQALNTLVEGQDSLLERLSRFSKWTIPQSYHTDR